MAGPGKGGGGSGGGPGGQCIMQIKVSHPRLAQILFQLLNLGLRGQGGPEDNASHRSRVSHLHLAQIKVLIQGLVLGLWEGFTVNLLRDTLLVADSTGCEGGNSLVTVQVSTPNLEQDTSVSTDL